MKKTLNRSLLSITLLALLLTALAGCGSKAVTVSFSLVGDSLHSEDSHTAYETWIDAAETRVAEDATALDVIRAAMEKAGYSFTDETYIYSVTKPDGTALVSGNNNPNSGWMFAVNGKLADVSMNDYIVAAGDHITLRFVDDYSTEIDWETSTFID